jgi:hypothetical protein
MPSCGMFHRVALVETDVSEVRIASIMRVTRIGERATTLAVTSKQSTQHGTVASYCCVPSSLILVALMIELICSSETLIVTRYTRRNIPEDGILQTKTRSVGLLRLTLYSKNLN